MAWEYASEKEANLCPFCRDSRIAIVDDVEEWYLVCGCGARGPVADTRLEALLAWNSANPTGITNHIGAERVDCTQGE